MFYKNVLYSKNEKEQKRYDYMNMEPRINNQQKM